jgi:uncharacterized membrane protein
MKHANIKHRINKFALAAAAAALFSSSVMSAESATEEVKEGPTFKCLGANSCKGTSKCATAQNSCAGQNSCKGHGWISVSGSKECEAKGGRIL